MKKNKIGDVILWIFVLIIMTNTILVYISYKMVCDNKKPIISLGKKENNKNIIYKEGLYKIVITKNEKTREVSLKLFFLK